jgi:hypothetical protein
MGSERQATQLDSNSAPSVEKRCPGYIPSSGVKGIVRRWAKRVYERGRDILRIEERCIGQHLVDIGSVRLPRIIGEAVPSAFIDLSKMSLVLGVDDSKCSPTTHNHIWNKVTERSVRWIGPLKGKDRLPKSADLDVPTDLRSFLSNDRLDIELPKAIERKLPCQAVELSTSAQTTLFDDPCDRLDSHAENEIGGRGSRQRTQLVAPWAQRQRVA